MNRAALLCLLGVVMACPAPARGVTTGTFTSGGVPIAIERIDTGSVEKCPAVLILHGSDGPREGYRAAARQVAATGYSAFLVHYLDRTGEARAALNAIGRNLSLWTQAVRHAVTYISRQPTVDPNRIGVLGISLGGGLALAAAQQDERVQAVVVDFGFVPRGFNPNGRLPPTLVLHGASDRVVPVANATALQKVLQARSIPHEIRSTPVRAMALWERRTRMQSAGLRPSWTAISAVIPPARSQSAD